MNDLLKENSTRSKTFTRRAVVIGGIQLGILGILGGRLAWLQVAEGQKYRTLAENNRINVKLLAPTRGEITDRFGVPLAINEQDFRVLILPEQTDNIKQALQNLSKYVDLDNRDIERTMKAVKRSARFVPVEIRNGLSRESVSRIEVNLPDLPGILTDTGRKRTYPFHEATAHLVGYVGAVTEKNIEDEHENPVLGLPGFRIGRTGIEKVYDHELRGIAGKADMEVNVVGREVRTLNEVKSQTGQRIVLTVDGELQRFVQRRLDQERSAAAVIMDVHSGAIYAMASSPSFDPNYFVDGISVDHWKEIQDNPAHPMNNKVLTGQYPPASTFKMIVALAFLEHGIATPQTHVNCPGYFYLGKEKFHCWKKHGHGRVNLYSALEQSCDVYFYELALQLGIDKIADMARRFGLGSPTNIESEREEDGLIPTTDWKFGRFSEKWQRGETIVHAIGQGYTLTTPIQLAVMVSRMVNGGYAVLPHLTGAIGNTPFIPPTFPSLNIDPTHMKMVIKGMEMVMNGGRGTARASQIKEPGMEMGGKTGTAQVKRITMAQRNAGIANADLPWEFRHHALFVGYAPLNTPRYACSVIVEHGVGGSSSAAPLARDIMLEAQKRAPAQTEITP